MAERNLGVEITRLIGEIHPTAFTGDVRALALATTYVADTLGGMFALIRRSAPNEATAQAAMKQIVTRALQFANDAQRDADGLKGQTAPAYHEKQGGDCHG